MKKINKIDVSSVNDAEMPITNSSLLGSLDSSMGQPESGQSYSGQRISSSKIMAN